MPTADLRQFRAPGLVYFKPGQSIIPKRFKMSQEQNAICPVVEVINSRPATTSLKIAECFEKNHQHVLRDIRALSEDCPENFNASNFGLVEYTDSKGEKRPMYTVYFDGFILLVMGYTGPKALKMKLAYIEAFNAMRQKLESGQAELPSSLTPADQNVIQALVKAIADRYPPEQQKRVYMQVWMRFRNHFQLGSYKDLPRSQMAEAVAYLANLKVNEKKEAPQTPKELPPALHPLEETGAQALEDYRQMRRDFAAVFIKMSGLVTDALYHKRYQSLNVTARQLADSLNASLLNFNMSVSTGLDAIENMFKAFCAAEKLLHG